MMTLFRMAFKNQDFVMVHALIPFAAKREVDARIGIMEDAVKTDNPEIVKAVYFGLNISEETIKPKLFTKIKALLPEENVSEPTETISADQFIEILTNGGEIADILAALERVEDADDIVEAVFKSGNYDVIEALIKRYCSEDLRNDAVQKWLKDNVDPELIGEIISTLEAQKENE